jgi:hypothetical protein
VLRHKLWLEAQDNYEGILTEKQKRALISGNLACHDGLFMIKLESAETVNPERNSFQPVHNNRIQSMRNKRSLVGLSILAGGLSFVGDARATDIVVDGSYESSTNNIAMTSYNQPVGMGGSDTPGIDGGWTTFSAYSYSSGYTQNGPAGSGQVYLRPYPPNVAGIPSSRHTVSQTNSLTRAITTTQIDGAQGQYSLSAWFSTYHGQNDYSDLTLEFLDASFASIGSPVTLGGLAFVSALPGGNGDRAWGKDTKLGLVPSGARYATITTISTAQTGSPDGYVDLVLLDVTSGFLPVSLNSPSPADNATGVNAGAVLSVVLQDGTQPLNNSSVQFLYDGSPVTPTIQKSGTSSTISYDPPGLMPSLSVHTFAVAWNNTGGTVPNTTNQFTFTAGPWVNINLGAPIHLETFDSVAEGALPSGWSVTNSTDPVVAGNDLNDVTSDAYLDWVVISRARLLNNIMSTNADFYGVTNVALNQVINGQLVTNLISGNFIWAVSDRVNNTKQIQYLFTRDYDLSGQTNVYLSFHNLYVQNQDSLGSVEYSIDGGATWLPALYMLEGGDILVNSQGQIDASNTLAVAHGDVPDIDAATLGNGHYGRYIGVAQNQWGSLAPYLSARGDDDETGSKRVEVIRLAQADNKPAVRFRFAQVGTWSWYFGIDDFGLYSISSANPPILGSPSPVTQTVALGNTATFTIGDASGVGPFSYQWRHYGTNLPGKTGQVLGLPVVHASDAGPYEVVVSNMGGSVTSAAPAAVLNVVNPAVFVTGQWDFNNGDLTTIYGANLQYFDATVQADTSFGTTASFGIPDISGQSVKVMRLNPSGGAWGGYKMFHLAAPNGGGAYVNQYTLIYDIYIPSSAWRSLLQTATDNSNDGDIFINPDNGLGITQVYEGNITPGAWHRIAFAFDLSGPGPAPVLTKFVDGLKVGNQTGGLSGPDGRFALDTFALLFGDNDGDINDTYVSSIQFSNGRRSDEYLKGITQGGPTPYKIPGAIRALKIGSTVNIFWTGFAGGTGLESADSLSGPWSPVVTATNPYPVPAGPGPKYYRPAIHFP